MIKSFFTRGSSLTVRQLQKRITSEGGAITLIGQSYFLP
jgi:hypothetical protein